MQPSDTEPTVDVYHLRQPDRFVVEPQTWDKFLVLCHAPEHITNMVIWGEIPPNLSTIAPKLQRLELRETPQHCIDK